MSLADQVYCSHILRELKANPVRQLEKFQLTVGLPKGSQTERKRLYFGAVDNEEKGQHMRVGLKSFCRLVVNDPVELECLATPMRQWNDDHRQDAMQRFVAAGKGTADLWVTVRQTGCSVLILHWGGGSCSMVHISPYDKSQFNRFNNTFRPANTNRGADLRGSYLRGELTTIANASRVGGQNPVGYILVQSSRSINEGKNLQLLGIGKDSEWKFYLQTKQENRLTVEALEWEAWNWYTSYRPVAW